MGFPYVKDALKGLFQSPVTDKYPVKKVETPEKYRGKIKFNPDVCIGCGICIRVCSPQAITKTVKPVEDGQEITMNFNLGSCTFCNLCADFCPRKAIELTGEYSMVSTNKDDLQVGGTFIKKMPPKKPVPKPAAPAAKEAAPKTEE